MPKEDISGKLQTPDLTKQAFRVTRPVSGTINAQQYSLNTGMTVWLNAEQALLLQEATELL